MNNNKNPINKEFYQLLNFLYSEYPVDSTNIINRVFDETISNWKKRNVKREIKKDPFHFLHYLLELIHLENIYPINPKFEEAYKNQITANRKNHDIMYNLFTLYFKQIKNSLISQYFYNIEKIEYQCPNCSTIYLYYPKHIITYDVEKYKGFRDECYPQKKGMNLNLEECLKCYQGGHTHQCNKCGDLNGQSFTYIFSTSKVLIINFKRNDHLFKGDIDFNMNYQMNNKNYILKACISYYNIPKYCADVCINNIWYRYINDDIKMLGDVNREIHELEPQLLIYELEENKNIRYNNQNNNQKIDNSFNQNNNQIIDNSFNRNNNQIIDNSFTYNANNPIMNNNFYNINYIPMIQQ